MVWAGSIIVVAASLATPGTGLAAIFVVNDPGAARDVDGCVPPDGICDTNDEMPGLQCTLEAALHNARCLPGPDHILFDVGGSDVLLSTVWAPDGDVTIDGGERKPRICFSGEFQPGGDNLVLRNLVISSREFTFIAGQTGLTVENVRFTKDPECSVNAGRVEVSVLSRTGLRFERNVVDGGLIVMGDDGVILNNRVGTDAGGASTLDAEGAADARLTITGNRNRVENNVVVQTLHIFGDHNTILRNSIGIDGAGAQALENASFEDPYARAVRVDGISNRLESNAILRPVLNRVYFENRRFLG